MHAYQMVSTGDMHGAIGKFKDLHANGASDEIRYRSGAMLANAYAITREFREGLMVVEETIGASAGIEDRDTRHHGLVASGILYNQVGEYELGRSEEHTSDLKSLMRISYAVFCLNKT